MKVHAIVFGAIFAVLSVAAASTSYARPHFGGPPAPLCSPDDTNCGSGGN